MQHVALAVQRIDRIEHDMDTALDMAERITVLHYGRVIVEGTRAEVVADPKTKEVYLGH